MNRDQALQEIKGRYAELLRPAKKRGTYICPLCHNGEGPDGDGITVKPGTTHLHCFKCGFGGDIVDLYQQEHGLDTREALEALYSHFGLTIDQEPTRTYNATQRAPQAPQEALEEEPKDYTEYFKQARANLQGAQEYLSFRGLSSIVQKMKSATVLK